MKIKLEQCTKIMVMVQSTLNSTISSLYNTFTKTEKKIAQYVSENHKFVIRSSINELAERVGVGRASILRFSHKLGAEGYHDLKIKLLKEASSTKNNIYVDTEKSSTLHRLMAEVTNENIETLKLSLLKVNEESVKAAAEKIIAAKEILILSKGISRALGLAASYKFLKLGINCTVPEDFHFQAYSISRLQQGSVIIIIDLTGMLGEYEQLIALAKKNDSTVISFTNYVSSPLTEVSDIVLLTEATESPLKDGELTAMLSQINILDMLYTLMVKNKGEEHLKYIEDLNNLIMQ